MGHAFECEYCESFHTATDGCEEYERRRKKKHTERNKNMYIVKETTKHGVVIHHGPFITMKGIRKFQQAKFEAGSKTVAHNLFVPTWNNEEEK